MGKGNKSLVGYDWKVFLVLAVSLNIVLISKVVYQRDGGQENKIGMLCVDAESGKYGDVHVETPSPTTISSNDVHNDVGDVGDGADHSDAHVIIDLDHGNPTMYEEYWRQMGDKTTIVIPGWQFISYFSDKNNICWFMEPDFAKAAIRLHNLVGNAATQDRYMVVGTGSSQLYQAVLYALTATDNSKPMSVVSAAPFYSAYPVLTDLLKSGLHKWAGDAYNYSTNEPYIEIVTSPNNPDGSTRRSVTSGDKRILIHDLAYYWPQYTPITHGADEDITLFTMSKSTGHAGTRIGWALVKDPEIAKKMTRYIEISTIGVSKDSQLRAAKILQTLSDQYNTTNNAEGKERFFDYSYNVMLKRWKELRAAVDNNEKFSLPKFSPDNCTFRGQSFEPQPAFAWLKCEDESVDDCANFLRGHNILGRSGKYFGSSPKYVRISMTDSNYKFKILTKRLAGLKSLDI
ncbi:hypothetical protein DCAR_0208425 [Daucus carota subsp. sativus]|uniref:Alliinase C-terminal domain-containing protein n=1 Tax=Daucus carota subsp. sativus TaxID=79200 RepID=A0AAF1AN07_DAUCS|nr:PREDICTED: tryptophan aminotransferase-related protein 2-like [Daucus carota subsp. sativus]WOG89189.1 hypothetical protein DCAR_0208425 [Daucus carota subsp. sativus]